MKKYILLILFLCSLFVINVNADENDVYYINDNGLEFTEYQYNVMVDILGEDNVATLSEDEYNTFEIANITEDNFNYTSYIEEDLTANSSKNVSTKGTSIETTYKKVTISATCISSYCNVTTICTWKKQPKVRSHDLIGLRFVGTQSYDTGYTVYMKTSTGTYGATGAKGASNGHGAVVKLRSENINYVTHTVKVLPQGSVYGTYQHATKTVSYATAYSFSFSGAGFGGVFLFNSSYGSMYDDMTGVDLDLPV